jgi:SAM-dependent methyltransferase
MDPGYAKQYADLYARHWWWRAREGCVLRRVAKIAAGRRLRILDVGCGDGVIWPKLAAFGDVEGIEPDGALIAPGSPHRSRIEIAPFPGRARSERYDLVLMLDVLEHIEDDRGALARVYELLAPGGRVLLTVPAHRFLWSEFDVMNHHCRRYSKKPLVRLIGDAGLAVVSARYYYFWIVLPLLVRRVLFRAGAATQSRFVRIPPAPINALFRALSTVDHRLTSVIPVPCGGSLIAVARRPASG